MMLGFVLTPHPTLDEPLLVSPLSTQATVTQMLLPVLNFMRAPLPFETLGLGD